MKNASKLISSAWAAFHNDGGWYEWGTLALHHLTYIFQCTLVNCDFNIAEIWHTRDNNFLLKQPSAQGGRDVIVESCQSLPTLLIAQYSLRTGGKEDINSKCCQEFKMKIPKKP